MIVALRRRVPLVFFLANLWACSSISDLETEGKLVDFGWFSMMGRYAMYLGSIDLTHEQERDFRVEGLPDGRDFVLSIDLKVEDCAAQKSDLKIALKMKEEHGKTVIDEDHSLRDLVWSTGADPCTQAYGYVRGKAWEIPINGGVCMHPIITGADGGNGTYFVSRKSAIYVVSVRVYGTPADMVGAPSVRVFLRDSGGHNFTAHCP